MANIRCLKNKDNPYVQINKNPFEITTLSWEAKGVWGYLMTKTDDWETNLKHLCKVFPGSRDRMRRIMKELQEHQLCYFEHVRKKGKFARGGYTIFESPEVFQKFFTETQNQAPIFTAQENTAPYLKKEEYVKNDSTKKKSLSKERPKEPPKDSYGEFKNVKLTGDEYEKLTQCFGVVGRDSRIEKLSLYLESKGTKYKSHYATILSWERRDKPNFKMSSGEKQEGWKNLSKTKPPKKSDGS